MTLLLHRGCKMTAMHCSHFAPSMEQYSHIFNQLVNLYQTQSGLKSLSQTVLEIYTKNVFAIHTQTQSAKNYKLSSLQSKQLINLKNYQRTIKFGIKQTLSCVSRDAWHYSLESTSWETWKLDGMCLFFETDVAIFRSNQSSSIIALSPPEKKGEGLNILGHVI